jgi:predicted nucleic acid-binding protein
MKDLLDQTGARGNLVSDVHLAALALEHRATLCTDDLDFKKFPGLKVELPLRKR